MLASSSGASTIRSRLGVALHGRSPWQLRAADKSALMGRGSGSSLGAGRVAGQRTLCRATAADADDVPPTWAQPLIVGVREAKEAAQEAKEASAAAAKEARRTRNIVAMVLEVAVNDVYARLGVRGPSTILQSMDDVLEFLLPCRTLLTASQDAMFFRTVRTASMASLLDKDTGFLIAVIVLLKTEGMDQEAGEVEAVLRSGAGIAVASNGLRTVRRCLRAAQSRAKAKGLGADIKEMYKYAAAKSTQERAALLETTLFVRCVAAVLRGHYTGVLQVDKGAGVGCEVDKGANALRLRAGETKYSPAEMEAASRQLHTLFLVAAFTLDKVLAAAAAAAAPEPAAAKARRALVKLPRRFIMDGFCVYVGDASEQQLQRRDAAADRRTEADKSVIGDSGLESAVLQVHFESARHMQL